MYHYDIQKSLDKFHINSINKGASTGNKWFSSEETQKNLIQSFSPVDGKLISTVEHTSKDIYSTVIHQSTIAFKEWRQIPAPKRGEIVKQIGNSLREYKEDLGKLVSYEMGKSYQEGLGEVQEMIDICDFAVGISRQLYGLTMPSERSLHRMYEQWHPLGVVGIISAFNFPVAVWSWNTMLAWVCGDVCIWKPSEKTPITAIACQKIVSDIFEKNNLPEGISNLVIGNYQIGEFLSEDVRIPLISATGSTIMGKKVAETVAKRLGKTLLELGGNNAIIISQYANLDIAIRSALFGAIGTAGQRCTTTRRLIVHESIFDEIKSKLLKAYQQIKIGNPLDEKNNVGPLIDTDSVRMYLDTLKKITETGGKTIVEGGVLSGKGYESGCYVKPAVYEVTSENILVKQETFAPILYLIRYQTIEQAIEIQNNVPQGLSSALITENFREAELFLSVNGSDCGIANINIGTSGAEIGGAFGGEKETGGGRESGSDSWKYYMRRQTNTVNYSTQLPLAQGIIFDL